ncbi:glycoside hydrolase domain-containing protein [Marinicrinis sediminis]|uniref:Glycoside hydrolase domain-containing protein n=1 Tax=Marinicrinis sediminis TaxID=1652465 RepID=A0ABW5RCR1_9BACL
MAGEKWGVDSASPVTENLYQCVNEQFGQPAFWGRYIKRVEGYADGLTLQEIRFLQDKGIRILPIYSDFRNATGYRSGKVTARNAIYHARLLNMPAGVFLFANIEHFFEVDESWLRGWVEAMYPSGYRPGFYHDPARGPFAEAYCRAASQDPLVREQAVLWSASPLPGPSPASQAPKFQPAKPACGANVWAWQYGKDAEACPIDTNLMDKKLYRHLW